MSKLEELVPPLELCKLIPKGEFEDSAFLYEAVVDMNTGETVNTHTVPRPSRIGSNPFVYHEIAKEFHLYPAPTLQEIMEKLHGGFHLTECNRGIRGWIIDCCVGIEDIYAGDEHNGSTAALKLWLKLKGIEYEK